MCVGVQFEDSLGLELMFVGSCLDLIIPCRASTEIFNFFQLANKKSGFILFKVVLIERKKLFYLRSHTHSKQHYAISARL